MGRVWRAAATKQNLPIFVSSTFNDLKAERPVCRERQVELVEIDLRWVISEKQSARGETLKLCLDEIPVAISTRRRQERTQLTRRNAGAADRDCQGKHIRKEEFMGGRISSLARRFSFPVGTTTCKRSAESTTNSR